MPTNSQALSPQGPTIPIDGLLKFLVDQGASDLHLKPMRPPLVRMNGKLVPLKADRCTPEALERTLRGILTPRQAQALEENLCVEFGYSVKGVARFRGSVYYQRGTLGGVFRCVPFVFPSLDEWKLPDVLKELTSLRQGLILITGPTGSGKSSTLAALIQQILNDRMVHVVTVEDPIEFILSDAQGAITQREVGSDTTNFSEALRNALRQDPDVIMVGENRDLETMSTTLTAAETGHLVLTTLHTNSAAQTIDRIIDMFPSNQQRQVRHQLSQVLRAVISMQLVERKNGEGMVAAVEILRDSPQVSKLIKEGQINELRDELEKSVSYHRMQTRNQSLAALVVQQAISRETAIEASDNPGDLDLLLRKFFFSRSESEDKTMPSDADFSRIHKLMEIERLYEDLQARQQQEIDDRQQRISDLENQLLTNQQSSAQFDQRVAEMDQERQRLAGQLEAQKQEYEAKIERLQARIKELNSGAAPEPAQAGRSTGFFRR